MTTLATILAAHSAYPDENGSGFRAACPVHETDGQHSDSLIIDVTDEGRALVCCQSRGCDFARIVAAVGLHPSDYVDVTHVGTSTRSTRKERTPAALAPRQRLAGQAYAEALALADALSADAAHPAADVLRFKYGIDPASVSVTESDRLGIGLHDDEALSVTARTGDGRVAFTQWRALAPDAASRFGSPSNPDDGSSWDSCGFIGARHPDAPVIIVEGISDALTVAALDAYDVVAIRGARLGDRIAEMADVLAGRRVVLAIDNDEAGRACRALVEHALAPIADTLQAVELAEGHDVGDLRDVDSVSFAGRFADAITAAGDVDRAPLPVDDFAIAPWLSAMTSVEYAKLVDAYATHIGRPLAHTERGWLVYDGQVWRKQYADDTYARRLAHDISEMARHQLKAKGAELSALPAPVKGDDAATDAHVLAESRLKRDMQRLSKLQRDTGNTGPIDRLLRELRSFEGVRLSEGDFDADRDLLQYRNGVLHKPTGELRPFDPAYRITAMADVDYVPDALAPEFEAFRRKMFVDEAGAFDPELDRYLQVLLGYGTTGHVREHVAAFLHGEGANGKSVLIGILSAVYGGIVIPAPSTTFMAKAGGGGIPNDLARLREARIVSISETNDGDKLDTARLKQFSAGDEISARFLNKEFFDFTPQGLVVMMTNKLPRVADQDRGTWRRFKVVPFNNNLPEAEWDRQLSERIIANEAEGFAAWIEQGARDWYANGLPHCGQVEAASARYKDAADPLGDWRAGWVVKADSPRAALYVLDAYKSYKAHCTATDVPSKVVAGRHRFEEVLGTHYGRSTKALSTPARHPGYRLLSVEEFAEMALGGYTLTEAREMPEADRVPLDAVLAHARSLKGTHEAPKQTMSDYYCRHRGVERETPTRDEYIVRRGYDPDAATPGGGLQATFQDKRGKSLAEKFAGAQP